MTPERIGKLTHVLNLREPDLTVIVEDVRKTHNAAHTCAGVANSVSPTLNWIVKVIATRIHY